MGKVVELPAKAKGIPWKRFDEDTPVEEPLLIAWVQDDEEVWALGFLTQTGQVVDTEGRLLVIDPESERLVGWATLDFPSFGKSD
jgi:hypothetical protein